jgi:hypothetical protein
MERPHQPIENAQTGNGAPYIPSSVYNPSEPQNEITSPAVTAEGVLPPVREHKPVAHATDRPAEPTDRPPAEHGHDVQLRTVSVKDFRWNHVEPFTVVDDISTMRGFDDVERAIAESINPTVMTKLSQGAVESERSIGRDRISNHLRPAKTNASLRDGQAIIVPFDAERAIAHDGRTRRSFPLEPALAEKAVGVVYTGELRSSRGYLGRLLLEATYYPRKIDFPSRQVSNMSYGYVLRTIGREDIIKELEEVAKSQTEDSIAYARKVANYALRRVFKGGLPE